PPLAEQLVQGLPPKPGKFSYGRHSQIVKPLLGDLANTRQFADSQRRQQRSLVAGQNPENAAWFGQIGSDLGNQLGAGDSDGHTQTSLLFDLTAQPMGKRQRVTVQPA